MSAPRRVSFRPSPLRLGLWGVAVVVIGVLAFMHDPGVLGDRLDEMRDQIERGEVGPRDSSRTIPVVQQVGSGAGALRLGVMARAAHLIALSGLEMNLYTVATKERGGVAPVFFTQAREMERALANGELDVAVAPLRSIVLLRAQLGEDAPVLVAGAARGDERLIAKGELDPSSLTKKNIGIAETPELELRELLKGANVVLSTHEALTKRLRGDLIDGAIFAEPVASATAALSSSEATELYGGASLVVARALLERDEQIVHALVQAHDLSAFWVEQDKEMAVARAIELLGRAGQKTTTDLFWKNALRTIETGTDLPVEALDELLAVARRLGKIDDADTVDAAGLARPEFLAEARRIRAEADEG